VIFFCIASELKSGLLLLLLLLRVELEVRGLRVDLRRQPRVLVLRPEVLLDDVEGLLVDLQVLVRLEELDLKQILWRISSRPSFTDKNFKTKLLKVGFLAFW
jgi:hypothetical protein